jgi:hypothetical protein
VSATITDVTPATPRTAASAALRTGSQAGTRLASTLIEKKTLPSLTTTSDSLPVFGSGAPSGLFTASRLARTSFFVKAITHSFTAAGQTPQGGRNHGNNIKAAATRSTPPRLDEGAACPIWSGVGPLAKANPMMAIRFMERLPFTGLPQRPHGTLMPR